MLLCAAAEPMLLEGQVRLQKDACTCCSKAYVARRPGEAAERRVYMLQQSPYRQAGTLQTNACMCCSRACVANKVKYAVHDCLYMLQQSPGVSKVKYSAEKCLCGLQQSLCCRKVCCREMLVCAAAEPMLLTG